MKIANNDNIIIRLLTSPQWKIIRHLILFGLIFFVSAGSIWHWQENGKIDSSFLQYGLLLLFITILSVFSYLNIYVLTPRLLLKNRWSNYFLSLCIIVLLIITTIALVDGCLDGENDIDEKIDYFRVIISILSASLVFVFLFAGISTLVLFKHWILDTREAEELRSATLQLELKLLENQINPHFLFNMLNNANIMVEDDPKLASKILRKLDDLLRYQMNDSTKETVLLKNDILFLTDFLDLEKTRRDSFEYTISKEENIDHVKIPPLLFIPFVENAVKHNSDSERLSYVNISFKVENGILTFTCENSKPKTPVKRKEGGLGLTNIKQRLDLLYGKNYSLQQSETETTYTVHLILNL